MSESSPSAMTPTPQQARGAASISRPRWALSKEAAGLGAFDHNVRTGALALDDAVIAMYGFTEGDPFDGTIKGFTARAHPDDLEYLTGALAEVAAAPGPLEVVHRIVLPSGRVRWMQVRGHAITGPDGSADRVVGVVFDVTDAHDAEQRAELVLESMAIGYVRLDADWTITYVNAEAERLTHGDRSQMLGANLWELFPAARGEPFEPPYRRVAETRTPETVEGYYPEPMNDWYEVRVIPEPGGGVAQYFVAIGDRRAAQQLLQLSVDIGQELVGSAEVGEAAAALARSVVPLIADWSIVSLLEPDGGVRDLRGVHRDPARQADVQQLMAHRAISGGAGIVDDVIATQQPRLVSGQEWLAAVDRQLASEATKAIRHLAPAVMAAFPLHAGRHTNGVLLLGRDAGRPPLTEQEHDLLVTICRRAGLAVDNARLTESLAAAAEHDRDVAAQLQQALLTDLPQLDDLQLVARYLTAVAPDQVGGDWTDAVITPGGATTVMVGDVAGHDIRAAAVMGQLRGMLRTFAWLGEASPAALLDQLDHAARDLGVDALATAVVARIEQTEDGLAAGVRTVRWSSAGHPPPVVLRPDGQTELLQPTGSNDILLGVAPDRPRHEWTWQAPPGSTLLLYTDGLIERRDAGLDTGVQRLRDALTRHYRRDLDELVDAVLADLVGERRDDDTALLAVRFHRQDGR